MEAENTADDYSGHRNRAEKYFNHLCRKLNIDTDTKKHALKLIFDVHKNGKAAEHELAHFWPVCAIWAIASRSIPSLRDSPVRSYVSLTQLLKANNTKLYDFFEPLQLFLEFAGLTEALGTVNNLKNKFIIMKILFEQYESLFDVIAKKPCKSIQFKSILYPKREEKVQMDLFKFGWLLFLVMRGKIKIDKNYEEALHLLLSSINVVLVHLPATHRKISVRDLFSESENRSDKSAEWKDTLSYLCKKIGANYYAVKPLQQGLFEPCLKTLIEHKILKHQAWRIPTDPQLSGSLYFGSLLDSCLDVNLRSLNTEYDIIHYNICDLDERLFLGNHDQVATPRTYYKHNSECESKSNVHFWLIQALENSDGQPTLELLKFFRACTSDPTETITNRVQELSKRLTFPYDNLKLRISGVKLYYKILEAILISERNRLEQTNFSTLLNHGDFHRSLLACCMEIVISTYEIHEMKFPAILELFKLPAFECCKVVESVIKHQKLPRQIVKHLIGMEEKILESLAWKGDSPLFTYIESQREIFKRKLKESGTQTHPTQSPCHAFQSPVRINKTKPVLVDKSNGKDTVKHKGPKKKSTIGNFSVELFFRKLSVLASLRVNKLCEDLKLAQTIARQVEYGLFYILVEHTYVIKNRHIDLIILCVLYTICKVNSILVDNERVRFQFLINKYRSQPQAVEGIYRNINLSENPKPPDNLPENNDALDAVRTGNIIQFYNEVFVRNLSKFLLGFKVDPIKYPKQFMNMNMGLQHNDGTKPGSTLYKDQKDSKQEQQQHSGSFPYSPLGNRSPFSKGSPFKSFGNSPRSSNVVISPLKSTPSYARSPHDAVYQFGMSPSKQLTNINSTVNHNSTVRCQLTFNEQLPISKSPRSALSPMMGKRKLSQTHLVKSAPPQPQPMRHNPQQINPQFHSQMHMPLRYHQNSMSLRQQLQYQMASQPSGQRRILPQQSMMMHPQNRLIHQQQGQKFILPRTRLLPQPQVRPQAVSKQLPMIQLKPLPMQNPLTQDQLMQPRRPLQIHHYRMPGSNAKQPVSSVNQPYDNFEHRAKRSKTA